MPEDQARLELCRNDIPGRIVPDHPRVRQRPGMIARVVLSRQRSKTHGDVVGGVLLQHLNIVKSIGIRPETLNEPSSRLTPVAKDLTLDLDRCASAKKNL